MIAEFPQADMEADDGDRCWPSNAGPFRPPVARGAVQRRLLPGRGHNRKPLLLVAPGLGSAVVPHIRYAASLVLTLAGGVVAKDLGQVPVTGDQVIVMESLTLDSHMHLR
jgi:hypothetical protein